LPESGYKNKLTVKIITDKDATAISGTVFGETEQRIVNVNGFKTDFKPKGRMIVFKNTDVPGVISSISSILAEEKINIADFRLGRDDNGFALAVILVDDDIKKDILAKLNALETCVWAEYAVL
ncbi:ACT domain-containing protein, partial [Campylobacter fetus]